MDFDLTSLRTFVVVTEAGGFTRAAERLYLTQSAVSHQIRRLEERVGRPLLYRSTRSLSLTEDGEDFLRYAKQILGTLDAMTQRFQPSSISGVVRFGVLENFMGERLPSILCQFARMFPCVRLDVNLSLGCDLCAMVRASELDLAVVMALADTVSGTVLRRTQLVWVAAEIFEVAHGASLPMAFFPAPHLSRQVGIAALESVPAEWHVVFTTQSLQGLRAAVLAGLAITVLTRDDLEPGMRIVDGQYGLPPLPEAEFTLIWSEKEKTPAVCEFGRLILDMSELSTVDQKGR